MHFVRGVVKTLVACFVLWHMFAVGVYALQNVNSLPPFRWLETKQNIVKPYVLMTSQWQRWNLFSPDPLRRVEYMRIDIQENGEWHTLTELNYNDFSFFRRASELKVVRRMEEDNSYDLRERYMQVMCKTYNLPQGTPIRRVRMYYIIPRDDEPQSVEVWKNWKPQWESIEPHETWCGKPLQVST